MQVRLIKVDNCHVFSVQWRVRTFVKVAYCSLESIQVVEILVRQLILLLKLVPETTSGLFQIAKLRIAIDSECRSESGNVREVRDVTRVKVQVLDEYRFHDLLRFLDL